MKRHDSKQEIRPARTTFKLTRNEVIAALDMFVTYQGEQVPSGVRNIWLTYNDPSDDGFATLVVDHTEAKAQP